MKVTRAQTYKMSLVTANQTFTGGQSPKTQLPTCIWHEIISILKISQCLLAASDDSHIIGYLFASLPTLPTKNGSEFPAAPREPANDSDRVGIVAKVANQWNVRIGMECSHACR